MIGHSLHFRTCSDHDLTRISLASFLWDVGHSVCLEEFHLMHYSHLLPRPPTPGGVPEMAVEMSGALTKVLPRQCGGNTRGLLYIDKKGSEMKINNRLRGKTAVVLPTSSPRRVGLLAGICWTKSQSPGYSMGLGGAVVTND